MMMKRPEFNVCVFCGSRNGAQPDYSDAARELGIAAAQRGLGLVYGGSSNGYQPILTSEYSGSSKLS
ncbi:hypothetical protein Hgul01_02674 [Herpetosiphon gulosus]|uniref:TIGR00730 family Rossman fold protein n=1 Tax=Herpetosiphon gulosus TaxID=1973496 RepID=A0ABP9X0C0_9CHLR